MSAIRHIRCNVFKVTQAEFAVLCGGVAQATVSRWENGTADPSLDDMRFIRQAAADRAIEWDDSLFFVTASEARP
jgi:DNA-binding transcriptional regulator YiaG